MNFYKDDSNNIVFLKDDEASEYTLIKANTEDAALEKHIPVYEIKNNQIYTKIGEVEHPMIEEHYIMWIALVNGAEINMKKLNPFDKPEATFNYIKGSTIYAYCNLHGLWKKEVE